MTAAVVTGAAMGIGRAVAGRLVADGVHVVAVDLNEEALAQARDEVGEAYEPLVGDVGDWDDTRARGRRRRAGRRPPCLGQQRRHRLGGRRPRGRRRAHRAGPTRTPAGRDVRRSSRRAPNAARPDRLDREHLVHPGRRRVPALLRVRRRQGGRPHGHQVDRGRLRAARDPLQRGPSRLHRDADDLLRPCRPSCRGRRRSGARGSWRRCCASANPRRLPRSSPSCSPDRASYVTGAEIVVDGGAVARCLRLPTPRALGGKHGTTGRQARARHGRLERDRP